MQYSASRNTDLDGVVLGIHKSSHRTVIDDDVKEDVLISLTVVREHIGLGNAVFNLSHVCLLSHAIFFAFGRCLYSILSASAKLS